MQNQRLVFHSHETSRNRGTAMERRVSRPALGWCHYMGDLDIDRAVLESSDSVRQTMSGPKFFEDLQQRIAELVAQSPAKDVERNVKAMMSSAFTRMDLVTREEFDVQAKVLARTRERLEQLEQRVTDLELKLGEPLSGQRPTPS